MVGLFLNTKEKLVRNSVFLNIVFSEDLAANRKWMRNCKQLLSLLVLWKYDRHVSIHGYLSLRHKFTRC